MKKHLLALFIILFLFVGCGNENNVSNNKRIPVEKIISSERLTMPDGRNSIEAKLYYAENIILRIESSEVIVKTGTNSSNITDLKDKLSLVDIGNGIIAVVEKVSSAEGELINFNLYQYSDKFINQVWSSNDLSAKIQNINSISGQFELYFPQYGITRNMQFSKDELDRWNQRVVELRDNNEKIDDNYYRDIKDNFIISPTTYHFVHSDDNGDNEIVILSNVYTVGAKTPYIRDRAVIIIKNDNGVISVDDITFERESSGHKSLFDYFN